ncbi:MAG: hypothetical protein WC533_00355 [Candidatus Pacearchaeota archaeon]
MQQTIFMIVAVTLFFVLVVLFYVSIKFSNLHSDVKELEKQKAIALVSKIASTPEFSFNENIPNSVDLDKLMILKSSENKERYKDFWGKNIKGFIIEKVYPKDTKDRECDSGNYPDCRIIKIYTEKDSAKVYSFVPLCKKQTYNGVAYDKCELGILMIDVEEDES